MNKFAVTNKDIVEGMQRSASALAAVGTSYNDAFALFTGANEILQQSEVTGRALRSISLRLRSFSEESSDDLLEVDESLANISGELLDLTKTASNPNGISIFKPGSTTEFKRLVDYFGEINAIWGELTEKQRNDYLIKAFGRTQAQAGAALIENYSSIKNALEEMENAAGSADREMGIIEESLEYRINKLLETWTGTIQKLIDSDLAKAVIDILVNISEAINGFVDSAGSFSIVPMVGLTTFIKEFKSLQEIGNDTTYLQGIKDIFEDISNLSQDSKPIELITEETVNNAQRTLDSLSENLNIPADIEIGNETIKDISKDLTNLTESIDIDFSVKNKDALDDAIEKAQSLIDKLADDDSIDNGLVEQLQDQLDALKETLSNTEDAANVASDALNEVTSSTETSADANAKLTTSSEQSTAALKQEGMQAGETATQEKIEAEATIEATAANDRFVVSSQSSAAAMEQEGASAGRATSGIAGIGTAAIGAGKVLAKFALQIAVITAISAAIGYAIKKINEYNRRFEIMAEKASKASENIKKINDDLKEQADGAKELAKRYDELAKGVDTLTNKNKNLNSDEYKEYLDITNKLSKKFPEFTITLDENGNAILDFSKKAGSASKSLEEFLEWEKEVANYKIAQNLPDLWGGVIAAEEDVKKAQENIDSLGSSVEELHKKIIDISDPNNTDNALFNSSFLEFDFDTSVESGIESYNALRNAFNEMWKALTPERRVELRDIFNISDTEFGNGITKTLLNLGNLQQGLTPDERKQLAFYFGSAFEEASIILSDTAADYRTEKSIADNALEAAFNDYIDSLSQGIEAKGSFKQLGEASQKLAKNIIENLDVSTKDAMKEAGGGYEWVSKYIIGQLGAIDKLPSDQKNKIENLILEMLAFEDGDLGILEVAKKLQSALNEAKITLDITPIIKDEKEFEDRFQKSISDTSGKIDKDLAAYTSGFTKEQKERWLEVTDGIGKATDKIKAYEESLKSISNLPDTTSISDIIDILNNQLKPSMDSLKSLWQEIWNDDGSFHPGEASLNAIANLKSQLDTLNNDENLNIDIDYSTFDQFVNTLKNTKATQEEVQAGFNAMATDIASKVIPSIGEMDEATYQSTLTMLEELGVMNAEEVMTQQLGTDWATYQQAKADAANAGTTLENVLSGNISTLSDEQIQAIASSDAILAVLKAEAQLSGSTIDVSAAIAALDALEGKAAAAAAAIKGALQAGQHIKNDESAHAQSERDKRKKNNEGINPVQVQYSGSNGTKTSGGGGGGGGAAGKEDADAYVEAFEKELEELKHLKDQGLITEKEYLDRYRVLYNKYFRDITKYAERYQEEQRKFLEETLNYLNKAVSGKHMCRVA